MGIAASQATSRMATSAKAENFAARGMRNRRQSAVVKINRPSQWLGAATIQKILDRMKNIGRHSVTDAGIMQLAAAGGG